LLLNLRGRRAAACHTYLVELLGGEMKFGVNTMVWTTRVTAQHQPLLVRIREWGFDGAELFLSPDEPADIPSIRKILDELQLERTTCSVMPRKAHLISADAGIRQRGVDFLKSCVERTAELGGHLLCGPIHAVLGVLTGRRRTEQEWSWPIEGL